MSQSVSQSVGRSVALETFDVPSLLLLLLLLVVVVAAAVVVIAITPMCLLVC